MAGLPADSPFRETSKVSLLSEIAELWRRSSNAAKKTTIKSDSVPDSERSVAA
jgi:hypothetical protein